MIKSPTSLFHETVVVSASDLSVAQNGLQDTVTKQDRSLPVLQEDPHLNPWQPMSKPIDIKHMSKLIEEFGEACAIVGRCMAQGIDECDPDTGQVNSKDLQDELADVQANIDLVVEHFRLDSDYMNTRKETKKSRLKKWHSALS